MPVDPVSNVAAAIKAVADTLGKWIGPLNLRKLHKTIDRQRDCIEYGEKFIRRYEKKIAPSQRDKQLVHYADKFFEYNN